MAQGAFLFYFSFFVGDLMTATVDADAAVSGWRLAIICNRFLCADSLEMC